MRSSLTALCCLQYLLALSPGSSRSLDWQAKRLEIKVYLSFNQQNSDKMELLQLILSSASTLNMIFSALFWSASVLHVKSIMLNSFEHSQS